MTARGRPESSIQSEIRNALVDEGYFFRVNVGRAWTGNVISRLQNGSILIEDPRPFSTGLPAGFPDLFGFVPAAITQDMVGTTMAVFTAIEVKSARGVEREKQAAFLAAVANAGGRAGVARGTDRALQIARGGRNECG